ncbi:YajG family lipoprotein [Salinibius halmophilus]|uniref:YajG family lipoprotein n=1 Tax=Salinibius halmophilus TaxID=1853216 RepID=UPI0013140ABB|nr:YajG family lipoprotein [Salinibius halmophilus]
MRTILALSAVVFLAGCTARSPQQIQLTSWDTQPVAVASQNETLALQVIDMRANEVLGSRGGVYEETAQVTLPESMLTEWQTTLEQAFIKNGWQPAQSGDLEVNVQLLQLSFSSQAGESYKRVLTNTDWTALVEVEYIGANGSMIREYRATRSFTDFPRPSVEDNQARAEEIFKSLTDNIIKNGEWERIL